jgi:hypothetical protein
MQGQKEAPPDMQCKDKFLLQSVVASPGATTKDITPEMVNIQQITNFFYMQMKKVQFSSLNSWESSLLVPKFIFSLE